MPRAAGPDLAVISAVGTRPYYLCVLRIRPPRLFGVRVSAVTTLPPSRCSGVALLGRQQRLRNRGEEKDQEGSGEAQARRLSLFSRSNARSSPALVTGWPSRAQASRPDPAEARDEVAEEVFGDPEAVVQEVDHDPLGHPRGRFVWQFLVDPGRCWPADGRSYPRGLGSWGGEVAPSGRCPYPAGARAGSLATPASLSRSRGSRLGEPADREHGQHQAGLPATAQRG